MGWCSAESSFRVTRALCFNVSDFVRFSSSNAACDGNDVAVSACGDVVVFDVEIEWISCRACGECLLYVLYVNVGND